MTDLSLGTMTDSDTADRQQAVIPTEDKEGSTSKVSRGSLGRGPGGTASGNKIVRNLGKSRSRNPSRVLEGVLRRVFNIQAGHGSKLASRER